MEVEWHKFIYSMLRKQHSVSSLHGFFKVHVMQFFFFKIDSYIEVRLIVSYLQRIHMIRDRQASNILKICPTNAMMLWSSRGIILDNRKIFAILWLITTESFTTPGFLLYLSSLPNYSNWMWTWVNRYLFVQEDILVLFRWTSDFGQRVFIFYTIPSSLFRQGNY